MRCAWLYSAQVRAAERCKAESNAAMVISHRVSKSKPNFENLASAYHLVYLRLIIRLKICLVACRDGADLSKLHGFEERRFLRVRGNLRAEVVLIIGIRAHPCFTFASNVVHADEAAVVEALCNSLQFGMPFTCRLGKSQEMRSVATWIAAAPDLRAASAAACAVPAIGFAVKGEVMLALRVCRLPFT